MLDSCSPAPMDRAVGMPEPAARGIILYICHRVSLHHVMAAVHILEARLL